MRYIRTKDSVLEVLMTNCGDFNTKRGWIELNEVLAEADTIEELCDEFVFFENGSINTVSCLAEAKDRLLEYREHNNNESRLIGRIQVGLDTKAVAEFEELKEGKYKGCYDWILL